MLKVLTKGCEPKRATKYSAAIDLFAAEDVVIAAGETVKVPLGVCVDLDILSKRLHKEKYSIFSKRDDFYSQTLNGSFEFFLSSHFLKLEPRSSLRAKGLQAGTGIIDLDYKDEICIILHNPLTLKTATNIAISWANKVLGALKFDLAFSYLKIDKDGFNDFGGYVIKKADFKNKIPASKIAQIMLCEHKSYLMGYESEEERIGGFGSTGEK